MPPVLFSRFQAELAQLQAHVLTMQDAVEQKEREINDAVQKEKQVSPLRMKITLLIAGFGPLLAVGLFLQSKGFFN